MLKIRNDTSVEAEPRLRRRLDLPLLVLYGTGITIGAGICSASLSSRAIDCVTRNRTDLDANSRIYELCSNDKQFITEVKFIFSI